MQHNIQKSFVVSATVFAIIAFSVLPGCAPKYGCYYGMTTPQISQQECMVMAPDMTTPDPLCAGAE